MFMNFRLDPELLFSEVVEVGFVEEGFLVDDSSGPSHGTLQVIVLSPTIIQA